MKKSSATRSSPAAKNSKKKGAGPTKVSTPKKMASIGATTPKKGHPTFAVMICEAIADIEGTVSRPAIAKWIKDHYDVNENQFATHLKNGFAKAEDEDKIVKVKASYKLKSTKKTKEGSTVKKAATKRKITTPKSKKPAKKIRTEKGSEREGLDDEEELENEEEPEGSQEGSADEGSQETDAGPMEDITAERPAEPESAPKSESADDASSDAIPDVDNSTTPGHAVDATEEREVESTERVGEMAVEGTEEQTASTDAQAHPESESVLKTERQNELPSDAIDGIDAPAETSGKGADEDEPEHVTEVSDDFEAQGKAASDDKVVEFAESSSKANEEPVAHVSNPGAAEVASEGTEPTPEAANANSFPAQSEESHVDIEAKTVLAPGMEDAMAVETV